MLYDPESTYRIAARRREDTLHAARLRAELRAAGIDAGWRASIAATLRRLADRVDDAPNARGADHRPQPAG